jgi:ATP-dependent Clp protease adaptor protein ClpS
LALFGSVLGLLGALSPLRRPFARQESALTIALTVAALDAVRRKRGPVVPAHIALAAVFALEREDGPDLSTIREALDAYLDGLPEAPIDSRSPLGTKVKAALMRLTLDRPETFATLQGLLDALRDDPLVEELLAAVILPPRSQPRGLAAPYRGHGEDTVRIVMHDDDVSSMEGVLAVLRDSFAKGSTEAMHLMLTTHYMGAVVVARRPLAEAEALRERATTQAQSMGMPLRVTVEAGSEVRGSLLRPSLVARVRRLFRAA